MSVKSVAVLAGVVGLFAGSLDASPAAKNADPAWTVPGEALVRFRAGVPQSRMTAVHAAVGAEVVQTFSIVPNLQLVRLPADVGLAAAAGRYTADKDVLYAQPNFVYRISRTPNDPLFSTLYGLHNTGQTGGTPDADIDAPEAWDHATGSRSVAVGDIDTGIDYNHPDLAASARPNVAECTGSPAKDDDANGYVDDCHGIDTFNHDSDPLDDEGHGTHTAGTIGAIGNNGIGVAGVNWNVTIVACKSHNGRGEGTSASIIECMQYMEVEKAHGVDVAATNNSYGGCPEACGFDQATYDAIKSNMGKNILFVAAAGNGNGQDNDSLPTYPGSYFLPNVVAVAATDSDDHLAGFSSVGSRSVLVGAPGVRIESTLPNGTYGFSSGTSMASPHVTGLAALLKSQNPRRKWWALRNLIASGGDDKPSLAGKTVTGRRVNAAGSATCSGRRFFGVLRPLANQPGRTVPVAALNIACAKGVRGALTVTINPGGAIVNLHDDGIAPDVARRDGVFSGAWSPAPCLPGNYTFSFSNGKSTQAAVSC